MQTEKKAAAAVIGAGLLWGAISVFVKRLSAAGLDSMQITLTRLVVAAVAFGAIMLCGDREKLKIKPRDIWMFIGTGIVSIVLFNLFYFYTVINSQASIAVVLLYTSPVFVMLISAAVFHERITRVKIAALLMTLAGCVLVAGLTNGFEIGLTVLLTGLGSGLFYALYTIFGRFALAKYDTSTVTAYTFLFGVIGALPFGNIGGIARTMVQEPVLLIYGAGIGLFCTALPYFLYTWGLQRIDSGRAALLVAVEPLVGSLIGMVFYGESHNAAKIVGIVLILAAVVLLGRPERDN